MSIIEGNELPTDGGNSAFFLGKEFRGGRYQIVEKIAQGGSAWLFKAIHQSLQEPMAIKMLYPQFLENETIRGRFLEEARIQFRLKHQHIVHITDVIDEDFCLGSVMEWVEGEDLRSFLRRVRRPLKLEEIEALFLPILGALHFIHGMGLVHRDIKPANILLSRNGNLSIPKLTDFGIAKSLIGEGHTVTGSTLGTVTYMAPEQINDAKQVTPLADIYSVGVILFQLLTGQVPFGGSPQQQLIKHLKDKPPKPSSINRTISPELDRLILQCMEKEPADRPKDCSVLLDKLFVLFHPKKKRSALEFSTVPMPKLELELELEDEAGLNTELEFLLDQFIDGSQDLLSAIGESDDGLPTMLADSEHLPKRQGQSIPIASAVGGVEKKLLSSTKMPTEREENDVLGRSSIIRLNLPDAKPIVGQQRRQAKTPHATGRQAPSELSSRQGKEKLPWRVLMVVGLFVVLVVSGMTWFLYQKKLERQKKNVVAVSTSQVKGQTQKGKKGKKREYCFKMIPSGTFFFFKFNGVRTIKRTAFCMKLPKGAQVSIKRNHFHTCEFLLPNQKMIKLSLRSQKETLLSAKADYCLH